MSYHVMLDLETMGNGSDAAIVAIGAVAFSGEHGIIETFYMPVTLSSSVASGGIIDPSTVLWWMEQPLAAREEIYSRKAVDITLALTEFKEFYSRTTNNKGSVWGNGATFDNVILGSAYRRSGLGQPWNFRNGLCYRTLKNMFPEILDRKSVV